MKYSVAAVLSAAAVVSASYPVNNVTVVTEVVESYTTYCPYPTEITHGDQTYTVTEATTLTITDCPCTITKPVITTSEVVCHDCPEVPEETTPWSNSTAIVTVPTVPVGTPSAEVPPPEVTAGAGKTAAFSGAGLALVGLAAFVL